MGENHENNNKQNPCRPGNKECEKFGKVYFFNCTDQCLNIRLNYVKDSEVIQVKMMELVDDDPKKKVGAANGESNESNGDDKKKYKLHECYVTRCDCARPYKPLPVCFGDYNTLEVWWGPGIRDVKTFHIDLTERIKQSMFQLQDNLIFYFFHEGLIVTTSDGQAYTVNEDNNELEPFPPPPATTS